MKKLAVLALLCLLAVPVFAQQTTGSGGFTVTFIQKLVWGNVTSGTNTVCTVSTTSTCTLPIISNKTQTFTVAVTGGTSPYFWTAATMPTGITMGTSSGLTNTISIAALTTNPCPATGACFTLNVTDSSIVSQRLQLSFGPQDNQVAIVVPASSVKVNGSTVKLGPGKQVAQLENTCWDVLAGNKMKQVKCLKEDQ
jgi:hypothetical protein